MNNLFMILYILLHILSIDEFKKLIENNNNINPSNVSQDKSSISNVSLIIYVKISLIKILIELKVFQK